MANEGAALSEVDSSWFALMLWRLFAGAGFLLALLFSRHALFGAVLLLLAALVCLPAARASFREVTGVRTPGTANAAIAFGLAVCGMASTGMSAETRPRAGKDSKLVATQAEARPSFQAPATPGCPGERVCSQPYRLPTAGAVSLQP